MWGLVSKLLARWFSWRPQIPLAFFYVLRLPSGTMWKDSPNPRLYGSSCLLTIFQSWTNNYIHVARKCCINYFSMLESCVEIPLTLTQWMILRRHVFFTVLTPFDAQWADFKNGASYFQKKILPTVLMFFGHLYKIMGMGIPRAA